MEKTTDTLTYILKGTAPDNLLDYLDSNRDELLLHDRPFAVYMRTLFKEKGILQQDVFANADISEGYGYKIISEEKHTRQRDTIIRICLGAGFTLDEMQRALKIYGMSPLYPRSARDSVILAAVNTGVTNVAEVNSLLEKYNESPLRQSEI